MTTMVTSTVVAATSSPTASTSTPTGSSTSAHVNNNPLLFFVALGFGVLFTNLWIIIGVKYCFRYQNARRRGIPMNGSDGMAMGNMHHGRRRREKKLMTMEEVETQFPLMTYKSWRAQRERQGLSTEGGVQAVGQEEAQNAREVLSGNTAPSRAQSIRTVRSRRGSLNSIEPVDTAHSGVYEIGNEGKRELFDTEDITQAEKPTSKGSMGKRSSITVEKEFIPKPRLSTSSNRIEDNQQTKEGETAQDDDVENSPVEEEIDETQITHLPQDIGSGDTCAICIDQLEEDDEVRGLTCGHAFHSSCVDVWLTTRRAICPLCKKDYWVRKTPLPENVEAPPLPTAIPTWRQYLLRGMMPERAPRGVAHPETATNDVPMQQQTAEADLESGRQGR